MSKLGLIAILVLYVLAILWMAYQMDVQDHIKDQRISALQAQVDGLRKQAATGMRIYAVDGLPHKSPKHMKPKNK